PEAATCQDCGLGFLGRVFRRPETFLFEAREIFAIALFFHLGHTYKAPDRRVDAVTQPAAIAWTVRKHVTQMAVRCAASNLCPNHAVRFVSPFDNLGWIDRSGERG